MEKNQLDSSKRMGVMETLGPSNPEFTRGTSRFRRVLDRLDEDKEIANEHGLRPREVILSDSNHLENQEISFIDDRDQGFVDANFKLTSQQFERVTEYLDEMLQKGPESEIEVRIGEIKYDDFVVSDAYEVQQGNLVVRVAKPEGFSPGNEIKRAAVGLVDVEIPVTDDAELTAEDIEARVNDVLVNLLGVPEGLDQPTPEAESQYKEARYRWHHKLPSGTLTPEQSEEITKLERREVFPSYNTMVSEGKHLEYEKEHGEFAVYHETNSPDQIVNTIQNGGLMSGHERFRRGLIAHGMSTGKDFETGGADSVFVRSVVEDSGRPLSASKFARYAFVMGPELYDRTDWYAYEDDKYGSTKEADFERRQSPEEVLEGQRRRGRMTGNEQMFRTGIPSETFKAIACSDEPGIRRQIGEALKLSTNDMNDLWGEGPDMVRAALASHGVEKIGSLSVKQLLSADKRMQMIDKLHEAGMTEVNGVPVEKFVVSAKTVDDFIDISHDRTPRSRQSMVRKLFRSVMSKIK